MKVFISWSGDKSKAVAEQLKDWLPQIINLLDPWISFEDIGKGRRWSPEIAGQLAVSKAGIVCVTASNRANPWLLFESALFRKP